MDQPHTFQSVRHAPTRELSLALSKNIDALLQQRRDRELRKSLEERIADRITGFTGSTTFVILHILWFTAWIAMGSGVFGIPSFDPFPYSLLTMIVSLEAIFLSTFVLISQNRMVEESDE